MTPAELRAHIVRLVDDAPPFTEATRTRLAALLQTPRIAEPPTSRQAAPDGPGLGEASGAPVLPPLGAPEVPRSRSA